MSVSRKVREAEEALLGLQGAVMAAERGDTEEFEEMYELSRSEIAAASVPLAALGFRDKVDAAVEKALALVSERRFDDAQTVLCEAGRALREASGSNEELRKTYKAK